MDEQEALKKLSEDKAFVWMRRRVPPLVAERVRKADVQGVFSVTEYGRFYPLKGFASHAVGVAGLDSRGLEGVELSYDSDLKAEPVPVTAHRDALGRPITFATASQQSRRRDLHLTLDRTFQYIAEKELDDAVHKEQAQSGIVLVTDADTGEILALAVRPTYNLNLFHKATADVMRNRAVSDTFEPGSTFKVFLAAAVLDLGRAASEEKFYCQKGLFRYKGAEIHDIVPHEWLSFDGVFIHSSNIGAVKVSEKLTNAEFYRLLQGFGFGSATGVDLPGERSGVLILPGKWSSLTRANLSFGQGITVNALQLVAGFAAAVNGGTLYRPHIMKKMTNAFGETIREYKPTAIRRVIKEATSAKVVDILRHVVTRGTGKAADIPGVEVVGKTGTAQKAAASGGYSNDKYVASFVGALMSTKPRIVIAVIIDEPAGKHKTGGKVAVPVFKRIAEGILAMSGSKPTDPGLVLASLGMIPLAAESARPTTIKVRKGQREGEWILPDLTGLSTRQVLDLCGTIKCDASFRGVGEAVEQSPRPGEVFKEGATLEVVFRGSSS
jgi:cell division protein FtsI (penicillin-binding protein 3)